jgi:[protein-PII] uridylyltransferase
VETWSNVPVVLFKGGDWFARIGTERGVAIDTFYIESGDHAAVENPERLHALRDALAEVIAAPAAATAAGK